MQRDQVLCFHNWMVVCVIERGEDELVSCTCLAHTNLLPFFVGNKTLLSEYRVLAQTNTDIQSEVDQLVKIVAGERSEDTPYVAPSPYAFNWQEDDWTKRLVPGIQKLFPNRRVTFTAAMRVFYRCSVCFAPSEPLRTTLMAKQTLREGVLQVFGVVRHLRTALQRKQTLGECILHVFGVVRTLRTSTNNISAQGNSW